MEDESVFDFRSWCDLPSEILYCIVSRVLGLKDRIQFGAVCKNWKYSFKLLPPSSWVWMFCTSPILHHDGTMKYASFSLPDNALSPHSRIPSRTRICGSFDGLLIATNDLTGRFFFLQPFSGSETRLPDLKREGRRYMSIRKAVASGEADLVVAALHDSYCLSICTQTGWAPFSPLQSNNFHFCDVIFYHGILHAIDNSGMLTVIRLLSSGAVAVWCPMFEIPPPHPTHEFFFYLAEVRGKLLMVIRVCQRDDRNTIEFILLELQWSPLEWSPLDWGPMHSLPSVEVKNLEGDALFIGASCSKSVPAARYQGVESDHIYFTADHGCLDSGVFSVVDGSMTKFPLASQAVWLHFTSG